MKSSFMAVHRESGKTFQLADVDAAGDFMRAAGKDQYDLHLCRKLDLRFTRMERLEPELKQILLFTDDGRYDLLTSFCAYLEAREFAFCREDDEGMGGQQWKEWAQAKRAVVEDFLGAVDGYENNLTELYTRNPEPAKEGKGEVRRSLQFIINDLEAGREGDALFRAVDLLRTLPSEEE